MKKNTLAMQLSRTQLQEAIEALLPLRTNLAPDIWWTKVALHLQPICGERTGHQIKGLARTYGLATFAAEPCKEPGCLKDRFCLGMCSMHYFRYRTHGNASGPEPRAPAEKRYATCHPDRPLMARGMCSRCYRRWREAAVC